MEHTRYQLIVHVVNWMGHTRYQLIGLCHHLSRRQDLNLWHGLFDLAEQVRRSRSGGHERYKENNCRNFEPSRHPTGSCSIMIITTIIMMIIIIIFVHVVLIVSAVVCSLHTSSRECD